MFSIADCGDYVVVINAKDVLVSGKKAEQKLYRHHTMYPGGLKEINFKNLQANDPTEVKTIEIKKMLTYIYYMFSLFVRLFQACYQRIDFDKFDWSV